MRLADTLGRFASRVEIAIAGLDDRLREGEDALARGDAMRARSAAHALLAAIPGSPLVPGGGAARMGAGAASARLVRAWVLDAPGASETLSSALAWVPSDEATRARVHAVADAKGEAGLARWRAAFARAEGKRDE